jgi:hypothetical protein
MTMLDTTTPAMTIPMTTAKARLSITEMPRKMMMRMMERRLMPTAWRIRISS